MKATREDPSLLAEKILEAEAKLERLEQAVEEIGQPAGHELRRRLDVLRIEENALKRNFEKSRRHGEPDCIRMEKIEALLRHIEEEEFSVGHDADFLHQAAPSSVTLAAKAVAGMIDLYRRAIGRVLGDHHPLGESVFVNHSHDALAAEYGLETPPSGEAPPDPDKAG